MRFFCTAPRNTGDLLAAEILEFGGTDIHEQTNGVRFSGSLETGYRLCLWSRIASKVLLEIKKFDMPAAEDLYTTVRSMDWKSHFDVDKTFVINATVTKASPANQKFAVLQTKDGIADFFRDTGGTRPSVDSKFADITIAVHVRDRDATIYLDLSGHSLHRRGYRRSAGPAPLKENVAAALLLRSGWPAIAAEGGSLVDPMCGSGTIPLEAALIAGGIAPGLSRKTFGFESWNKHQPELWQKIVAEAKLKRKAGIEKIPRITGYDQDRHSITAAVMSSEILDLAGIVHFEKRELSDAMPPGNKAGKGEFAGLVAINPPYGVRLGTKEELLRLYRNLGDTLKASFPGWKAAILTGDQELSMATALRAIKVNTLYNGAIPCILAQSVIHAAGSDARSRALSGEPASATPKVGKKDIYTEQFGNRLTKNFKHIKKWSAAEDVSCYRVYDADMPEFSAAIDVYENTWVHVQEYQAPDTIDKNQARRRLQVILDVVPDVLDVKRENLYVKTRARQESGSQYEHIDSTGTFNEIREGGQLFLVNFTDYIDTGIFLDHRLTRKMIRDMADGRRFLNLFSYTASATVYAAAGGAAASVSVDNSNTYSAWARDNLSLNGIFDEEHKLIRDEARLFLTHQTEKYDLIFIDPPTFSRSKRFKNTFQVQRDHVELIELALSRLSPDGILLFSTNFKKFKLDYDAFKGLAVKDLTAVSVPEDYSRNKKIHQLWKITR
ncbi:MAG: bifunctional 23S rRNA (guanine(2069)-N(7))-methyltransferase RlmK/23S rRNA (guanine(2445)-N(2))-methyltransferase RlmL [Spirochaetales bacterium]|jgi:23S rRNA (guanine2445-N2)-methyltransferase / 23S rRNA (guanine2069-N7)-methyltransferase|nr:bifunctional 23S rRNA (guanine(2069)-N(7))-methyltransferase RlmK/23S rRNA (guanine(2445)-N(2))-methyltransferase RlmL [Spirochaetales bacterium]